MILGVACWAFSSALPVNRFGLTAVVIDSKVKDSMRARAKVPEEMDQSDGEHAHENGCE